MSPPPHVPDNAQDDSARPSSSGSIRRLGSMGRRRTQPPESGLRKNANFAKLARQSTEASLLPKGPKPVRNTCDAYDLPWETLRDFLVGKFPEYTVKITVGCYVRRLSPIIYDTCDVFLMLTATPLIVRKRPLYL